MRCLMIAYDCLLMRPQKLLAGLGMCRAVEPLFYQTSLMGCKAPRIDTYAPEPSDNKAAAVRS